jgi:hypothetical protein
MSEFLNKTAFSISAQKELFELGGNIIYFQLGHCKGTFDAQES